MITLKTLNWDNVFSYGKNNSIDFSKHPITQLVGANGNGKSSIPLILELVLFNKNSKGIKTGDIINRYTKDKSYKIELSFSKDNDDYLITVNRASTATVKLSKNGADISAHTATNTYKLIEEILGFSHKEFVQLIYQSSADSLEFLTATDSARKKFLIDLLDLGVYNEHYETFKTIAKTVNEQLKELETKANIVNSWISKNATKDLTIKELQEVPKAPDAEKVEIAEINKSIANIAATNKRINDNNKYIELVANIDPSTYQFIPVHGDKPGLLARKAVVSKEITDATNFINKVSKLHNNCPTCNAPLDNSQSKKLAEEKKLTKIQLEEELKKLTLEIEEIQKIEKVNEQTKAQLTAFETYSSLIDDGLPKEILSKNDLEDRVIALTSLIKSTEAKIKAAQDYNTKIAEHNAAATVIASQMEEMKSDLAICNVELAVVAKRVNRLQILQKAFKELPAYKIEGLIKDLEITINEYLTEFSNGRFQLAFVMNDEKLNVVITDNGIDIDISSLSNGELTRVNTSTLLAIRKMMQQLSDVKVNLLILDEVLEHLDPIGKEEFIRILLEENHLNTVLVSHSYTHPLIEKINVIKENNISRIE